MGLIAATAIFSVGVAFQVAATAIPLMVVGRLIAGFGVGLVSALGMSPLFLVRAVAGCFVPLANRSCFFPLSAHVPVGVRTQVDQRNNRRMLPIGYHHRSAVGLLRQPGHPQP